MLVRHTLRNASLLAEVVPAIGGGLSRLEWHGKPLLRGLPPGAAQRPLPGQLACFPLLPWSNRMAPGGFEFEWRRYVPAPNRAGEPCPIHGDAWQQEWQVERHEDAALTLALDRRTAHPFSYKSTITYRLEGDALVVEIELFNAGGVALPFGSGLHPWMPDPQGAVLRAPAGGVWMAGSDKLPVKEQLVPPEWDFAGLRSLPVDGVDNAFSGWGGRAAIHWPGRGVGLEIEADMDYFILYVPPGRDFFCFEPVDHPINAHNLPGRPGLSVLQPGEGLRRRCVFRGVGL